jgi:glycosyltransferase involved in cell wall biosynthesis
MKITIIQGAFLPVPPLQGGAIEKAWEALSIYFANNGHHVTYISKQFKSLPIAETKKGVKHIRVKGFDSPKNPLSLKFFDLLYSLRVKKIIEPSEIIVTHTFWLPIILKKQKLEKVFVHVGRYPKGQMRFYKNAACLQAPSKAIHDAIIKEVPHLADKTTTLPYPLPFDLPKYIPTYQKKNTLLYCGRIHPEKGVHHLLDAYSKLASDIKNNWVLKIIGSWNINQGGGGAEYLNSLKNIAADNNVQFIEPIFDKQELNKEYQAAKIFVYPSLAEKGETFGLAPLEAMANSCVPIVSGLDCFKDFISDRFNGLIFNHRDDNCAKILAQSIENLIKNENLEKMNLKSYQTSTDYDIQSVGSKYLEKFKNLIPSQ